MTLEDLVLKHYRAERQGNKMVAIEDPNGLYMADSAEAVERALNSQSNIRKTDNIFCRTSIKSKWHLMKRR